MTNLLTFWGLYPTYVLSNSILYQIHELIRSKRVRETLLVLTHDVQNVLVLQNFGRLSISPPLLPQLRLPLLPLDLPSFRHLGVDEINRHLVLQLLLSAKWCHHSEVQITSGHRPDQGNDDVELAFIQDSCLNSSRNHVLHPLHIVTAPGSS